jgi:hypothetical protein
VTGVDVIAALEARRSLRTGRGFTLVRLAPVGGAPLDGELLALERLVEAELRSTDHVQRTDRRELGVVLTETTGLAATAPLARLRMAIATELPLLKVRIGWATAGPSGQWQEAWRWAGTMLVADATVPAAA